jgi:hypothetical protein
MFLVVGDWLLVVGYWLLVVGDFGGRWLVSGSWIKFLKPGTKD